MSADDLSLPDDMDLLKAMVRAMAEKTAALEGENAALEARGSDADERIKRLMQILKAYDRARFGRRSEKLGASEPRADDEAQQAFVFEEIETGIAALRAQTGKGQSSGEKRPPRPRKGHHRDALADLQDEQRRPRRVADTDPGAHRQSMAERRDRRSHALELQSLNGLSCPLTLEPLLLRLVAFDIRQA